MITSTERGHKIFMGNDGVWRYSNNKKIVDGKRSCKKCGKLPTKEGHDACMGKVKNATSVCCGHGVEAPYIVMGDL